MNRKNKKIQQQIFPIKKFKLKKLIPKLFNNILKVNIFKLKIFVYYFIYICEIIHFCIEDKYYYFLTTLKNISNEEYDYMVK